MKLLGLGSVVVYLGEVGHVARIYRDGVLIVCGSQEWLISLKDAEKLV